MESSLLKKKTLDYYMKLVKITVRHKDNYKIVIGTLENRIWGNNNEIDKIEIATDSGTVAIPSADIIEITLS